MRLEDRKDNTKLDIMFAFYCHLPTAYCHGEEWLGEESPSLQPAWHCAPPAGYAPGQARGMPSFFRRPAASLAVFRYPLWAGLSFGDCSEIGDKIKVVDCWVAFGNPTYGDSPSFEPRATSIDTSFDTVKRASCFFIRIAKRES